jgi:restriction endonuclease
MTQRSKYDELHDRYHAILSSKAGTRYEILAAMVFKILEDRNVVIHDLKLSGDSQVPHQIDVSIEVDGKKRRVIIECKDFDVSGEKVGLDILRSFRSVIEDTNVDEGIVLTCTGYTKEAQKYAKSKNIKLAVLREVRDGDLEGIIKTVVVNLYVQSNKDPETTVSMSDANRDLLIAECKRVGIEGGIHHFQPVYFVRGDDRIQFTEFLSAEVNKRRATKNASGRWEVVTLPDGWRLQVEGGPLVPFDSITTTYDLDTQMFPITATSNRIAELIVKGLGDDDIFIFGDQLERRKIDPETGEIL